MSTEKGLEFHDAFHVIAMPISIASAAYSAYELMGVSTFDVVALSAYAGLGVVTFFGMFAWKPWSYTCLMAMLVFGMLYRAYTVFTYVTYGLPVPMNELAYAAGTVAASVVVIAYYRRRRELFDGKKTYD